MEKHRIGWTEVRWLAMSLSLLVAAACSGGATSSPASRPTESASTASLTSLEGTVRGAGDHPGFQVQAPLAWSSYGAYIADDATDAWLAITVWDVGKVPSNPCHSIGHLHDPGRTVDDLAAALAAEPTRNATAPTDVMLAGYSGKYLQWSVPSDAVVTGDGDFKGCDVQSDGHRNFVSWTGHGGEGERWQQMAGQVDRLWILDVNGQRLLVDATHSPDATQSQLDEQDRIVQSLRFVPSAG